MTASLLFSISSIGLFLAHLVYLDPLQNRLFQIRSAGIQILHQVCFVVELLLNLASCIWIWDTQFAPIAAINSIIFAFLLSIILHNSVAWLLGPPCYARKPGKVSTATFQVDFVREEILQEREEFQGCGIGICPAPGRWKDIRGLERDLQEILRAAGEHSMENLIVITLLTEEEMNLMEFGVEIYGQAFREKGMHWIHFPMRDKWVSRTLNDVYNLCMLELVPRLKKQRKSSLIIHCFGGKGRSGTIAACILICGLNLSASEAIKTVRLTRKGALKNALQRYFLFCFSRFVQQQNIRSR